MDLEGGSNFEQIFVFFPPSPHPPFPVIHVDLTAPKAFLRIFAEKEVFPSG